MSACQYSLIKTVSVPPPRLLVFSLKRQYFVSVFALKHRDLAPLSTPHRFRPGKQDLARYIPDNVEKRCPSFPFTNLISFPPSFFTPHSLRNCDPRKPGLSKLIELFKLIIYCDFIYIIIYGFTYFIEYSD